MPEKYFPREVQTLSDNIGTIIGWSAVVLSIIGFFIWSIPLGAIAMVLSVIGLLASEVKGLNWTALALSAIAIILGIL